MFTAGTVTSIRKTSLRKYGSYRRRVQHPTVVLLTLSWRHWGICVSCVLPYSVTTV